MKWYRLFLLSAYFIFCQYNLVLAQADPSEDRIIYLDDGSVLIGRVVNENQDQIVLAGTTGDTLHINKSLTRDTRKKIKAAKFHYTNGPFALFDIGLVNAYNGSQIDFILGYRLNEKYALGVGIGSHSVYSKLNGLYTGNVFKPIYGYIRKYIDINKNIKPFLFMNAGYGFVPRQDIVWGWFGNQDSYNGGAYAQPGIGLNFASRNKFRLILSVSQNFQYYSGKQHKFDVFSNPVEIDYSGIYSQFTFKIGVEFR